MADWLGSDKEESLSIMLLCLLCSTAAPCKYSLKSPSFSLLVRQGWHPITSWRD